MIDTTKAKADAEEGLRIAEKATEGPWSVGVRQVNDLVAVGDSTDYVIAGASLDDDAKFIADSRTRAPEAYRNAIEMAGRLDVATSVIDRLNADRVRMLADLVDLDAKVAAAELAEEKMTRKAEEHYERAVLAEAEIVRLKALVAKINWKEQL